MLIIRMYIYFCRNLLKVLSKFSFKIIIWLSISIYYIFEFCCKRAKIMTFKMEHISILIAMCLFVASRIYLYMWHYLKENAEVEFVVSKVIKRVLQNNMFKLSYIRVSPRSHLHNTLYKILQKGLYIYIVIAHKVKLEILLIFFRLKNIIFIILSNINFIFVLFTHTHTFTKRTLS